VLDPFFERLARDCIEKQPRDPLSFMQDWISRQKGPEPEPLKAFIGSWCGDRSDEVKKQAQRLANLESQHAALKKALGSTGLGCCALLKLAENPVDFASFGLPDGSGEMELGKVVKLQLEKSAKREESLVAENQKLRDDNAVLLRTYCKEGGADQKLLAENQKLREDNAALLREVSNLKAAPASASVAPALTQQRAKSKEHSSRPQDSADSNQIIEPPKPPEPGIFSPQSTRTDFPPEGGAAGSDQALSCFIPEAGSDQAIEPEARLSLSQFREIRGPSECMGAVLRKLMVKGETGVSAAFSFFEPEESGIVQREKLVKGIGDLEGLEADEIEELANYLDPHQTGKIYFEDFKMALLTFLASSGDVHSSFSEDEFNAVMSRIKSKFDSKGLSCVEAFTEYDTDNSGTLARNEFIEGLQRLELGLSTKEIAQLFYAMDASGDGTLSLFEFEEAIQSGAVNPLRDWALDTFERIGDTLQRAAVLTACQKHAAAPSLKTITHDGFVKFMREHEDTLNLSDIGRLWCVLDKVGDATGRADVAELCLHFGPRMRMG